MVRASNPRPPQQRPKKKVALAAQQAAPQEEAPAVPVIPQAPWGGEFSVGDRVEVRDMDGPPGIFQGTITYRINVEGHITYQVTLDNDEVWPCVCEHQIRARTERGPH